MADWVELPFRVQRPQAGLRVDAYLAGRLARYSRARVQGLIAEGRVLLRGRAAKPSLRVADGDTVLVRYPRREEEPARHESLPVLYEDAHLLAVDKPADLLSHPTDRVLRNSVTSVLRLQFPGLAPRLAHRLDRETSGVLLLARSAEAARRLTEAFSGRAVLKTYLALARGRVTFRRRVVDLPLGREGGEIKVRQAPASDMSAGTWREENGFRQAVTVLRRLAAGDRFSLVAALPRTGRLHQVRAHLAALGHPVLGDKLYTGAGEAYLKAVRRELRQEDLDRLGAPRQMLHARRLSLEHPITGARLSIVSPLPADFAALLRRL